MTCILRLYRRGKQFRNFYLKTITHFINPCSGCSTNRIEQTKNYFVYSVILVSLLIYLLQIGTYTVQECQDKNRDLPLPSPSSNSGRQYLDRKRTDVPPLDRRKIKPNHTTYNIYGDILIYRWCASLSNLMFN